MIDNTYIASTPDSKIKIEDCISENILENPYITSNKSNYDWLIVQKNKVFISNVFL